MSIELCPLCNGEGKLWVSDNKTHEADKTLVCVKCKHWDDLDSCTGGQCRILASFNISASSDIVIVTPADFSCSLFKGKE